VRAIGEPYYGSIGTIRAPPMTTNCRFAGLFKPERGLEPLTYRLQGDIPARLEWPILPAKSHVAGRGAAADFRLIWAGFGWLRDNEARRCP
jgi:hypothetical protein